MRYVAILFLLGTLASCGMKVPFTQQTRQEFDLDSEKAMGKVQFFTSATIILQRSQESGSQGTNDDGALVQNSNKNEDRIIIPVGTKCIFERFDDNNNIVVRFESGAGNTISFGMRQGQASGKYYFLADWKSGKGGKITYGNKEYYASSASGAAYLQVIKKRLQKTQRNDRVVKGMKV